MERDIELLKVKIDREKYYHNQSTSRFFTLTVLLVGIIFLNPKSVESLKLSGTSFFIIFLILVLIISIMTSVFTFVTTRKNLEKYYDALEEKLK